MNAITLIAGDAASDDRGTLTFVNDVDFQLVKRFYIVSNHVAGFVRAWHGHRREEKFVTVVQGTAVVAAVQIDDWERPSQDLPIHRYVLSAGKPELLHIPAGYANGAMTLTTDARILYFSTALLAEAQSDDIRFPARYWDPWRVEER